MKHGKICEFLKVLKPVVRHDILYCQSLYCFDSVNVLKLVNWFNCFKLLQSHVCFTLTYFWDAKCFVCADKGCLVFYSFLQMMLASMKMKWRHPHLLARRDCILVEAPVWQNMGSGARSSVAWDFPRSGPPTCFWCECPWMLFMNVCGWGWNSDLREILPSWVYDR